MTALTLSHLLAAGAGMAPAVARPVDPEAAPTMAHLTPRIGTIHAATLVGVRFYPAKGAPFTAEDEAFWLAELMPGRDHDEAYAIALALQALLVTSP